MMKIEVNYHSGFAEIKGKAVDPDSLQKIKQELIDYRFNRLAIPLSTGAAIVESIFRMYCSQANCPLFNLRCQGLASIRASDGLMKQESDRDLPENCPMVDQTMTI